MNRYAFDNCWYAARERLAAIETWLDPGTFRHLSDVGIGAGWSCLEIGASGGSVAEWLCEQVGAQGIVLATDLDPRFVARIDQPNLEVRQHNIISDPLPNEAFDLIHTRLVLGHLEDHDAAIERSIAALKPGGWFVAEEMDLVTMLPTPWLDGDHAQRFEKAMAAQEAVLLEHGFDPFYGRQLPGDLVANGLAGVESEARAFVCFGGSPGARAVRLTLEQIFDEIVATGELSTEELASVVEQLDKPDQAFLSQMTIAAWGRRL